MSATIPDDFRDLFERPIYAVVTTVMPSGQPQSTVVWVDYDGTFVRINTVQGRQKERNLRRNPKITLVLLDPDNAYRWIEVRGQVESITEGGGVEHIEALSRKYNNGRAYYGDWNTRTTPQTETRVVVNIRPVKVFPYWTRGRPTTS
jgi:PPOX class probable F420-dependent enzyme